VGGWCSLWLRNCWLPTGSLSFLVAVWPVTRGPIDGQAPKQRRLTVASPVPTAPRGDSARPHCTIPTGGASGENKLQSLHIRVGVITADRRDEVWRPGRRRCRRVLGRGTHGKISRPIYAVGQMNRIDRPGTRGRAHLLSCVAGSRSMRDGR